MSSRYFSKIQDGYQGLRKGFLLLLIALLSLNMSLARAENQTLKPITVQLKWKHQFQFAGFYAALEKGYYAEAGFDVNLKEANFDTDPIREVLDGRADFGLANSELVLYRLQGHPVTALAVIIQHSPIVLMTLTDSNILSPQDLIGKKVMYPQGHYGANTLGIMLREGVSRHQFESIPLSFNILDLTDRKVDAMVGYVTDQPYLLQEMGVDYRLLDPRTYGIDFYGDTLFTTVERANNSTEDVERFRQATLEGWRYAIKHSQEVISWLLNKYQSEKSKAELEFEAVETIKLIVPDLVEIGHMNPGRWQHIAETFIDLGMADGMVPMNEFLYEPRVRESKQLFTNMVIGIAILVFISLLVTVVLVSFNNRLRQVVSIKTKDLVEKNQALKESQTKLLMQEEQLNILNKDLEKKVEDRTISLNRVNNSLLEEIDYRKEKELSLELLHQAIASSNSAVLIIDKHKIIQYASAALGSLMGVDKDALKGKSFDSLETAIELPKLFKEKVINISGFKVFSEVRSKTGSGEEHWLQVSVSPMSLEGSGISHYVIVCEDISELKLSKDKLEKMALYDALTELENRTLFNIRLEKAIQRAQRNASKTALLFIDIDHFKSINDSFGHEAGDRILKRAAERLRRSVRNNDPVARISGDEFTILLGDIHSYNDASKVAEHIVKAFNEPVKVDSQEVFVTASIGISITPDDAIDQDELIRNADVAMYEAKQKGRNNYQFFSRDMNTEIQRKRSMEIELMSALEKDAFYLVFQPKIHLKTGRLVGVEALVRWRLSEQEVRMPNEFICVAEETGIIIPLGYKVIEKAIEGFEWLLEQGFEEVKVSVNVSARQVKDQGFVLGVKQRFGENPDWMSSFELELTESAFIGENQDGIVRLNQLRELGFGISIDDFGTGYSSLSYLQKLPVDTLKIDQSFISDLPQDTRNAEISKTVIAMANNLNFAVVAEGVETEAQAHFLRDNQCDIAQGYLYGKPMSLKELAMAYADQRVG